MVKLFGKTFVSALLTLWLVMSLVFFVLRWLPGDAISSQMAQAGISETEIQRRLQALGMKDPLMVQYLRFWTAWLRGEWGVSLYSGQDVRELLAQRLPNSLTLMAGAMVIATSLGLTLGISAALELPYGIGTLAQVITRLALSVPLYWTATLVLFVSATHLGGVYQAWLLPMSVLGFHSAASISRLSYTNIQTAKYADFVRTAHAKGLPNTLILRRHILRIALLPTISVIALQSGMIFGGAIFTETLFLRPGLGLLLLNATLERDYPVVQGVVMLSSIAIITLNRLADWVSALIDPRLRYP